MAVIGHDNKRRTVTFSGGEGGDGPTEGAYRVARGWARAEIFFGAVPAAILALVSTVRMVDFATDLATTWGQVLLFSLTAIALTVASTWFLARAELVKHSNPVAAKRMQMAWVGSLVLAGIALLFFVARMDDSSSPPSGQAAARAEELRHALRFIPQAELTVWDRSGKCRAPQSSADRATCDAITARDDGYRAELKAIEGGTWQTGWTPRDVIGTGHVAGMSDFLRRLLAAMFTLLAMAGAGVLAQWAAMGHAEAFRQADGIVSGPAASGPSVAAGGPPALVSPLETTELWFQGRVLPDPNGKMSPTAAYLDYEAACQVNGLPPMTSSAFYNLLAAKAKASGGAITRVKSNGQHLYAGWTLATADMGQVTADPGDMLALPYRS